ncbi:hypothetical protein [Streptomyces sp. NPDC048527]
MAHPQREFRPGELERETQLEPRQIVAGLAWLEELRHRSAPG